MRENDACTIFSKPSATAYMKYNLAVTDGKVINAPAFGKTIGRKVMPLLLSQVAFIKIDMNDAYFSTCLI